MREVQQNQHEILHLRRRLGLAQLGFSDTDQLLMDEDIDDENQNVAEISILKLV